MMLLLNEFNIGQIVYLRTDKEQHKRMVVEIHVMPYNYKYRVACGNDECIAYEIELSSEPDITIV